MNLKGYPVISDSKYEVFEFLSEGSNGVINKVVEYQQIGDNVFNLAFGDKTKDHQRINDSVRSNNNDRDKVLATVALTVIDFMKYHPNALLFARGSTDSRTRLYQMGISSNWMVINQLFYVKGYYNNEWEFFETGKNYEAFSIKSRIKQ